MDQSQNLVRSMFGETALVERKIIEIRSPVLEIGYPSAEKNDNIHTYTTHRL